MSKLTYRSPKPGEPKVSRINTSSQARAQNPGRSKRSERNQRKAAGHNLLRAIFGEKPKHKSGLRKSRGRKR